MASGQIMKKPDLLKLIILQLKKQRPREKWCGQDCMACVLVNIVTFTQNRQQNCHLVLFKSKFSQFR